MVRFKHTSEGLIPFTVAEEAERDAEEAAWAANLLTITRKNMIVTRFQALAAMHGAGILTQVQAVMADPLTDPIVKLAWENALEFKRLSPTVVQLAQSLGLTDEQLDSLFTTAKGIEA